jgi:penicillin-binding protein 2
VETNVEGRALGTVGRVPATSGADLRLSIDLDLQQAAAEAFGDFDGSAVAVDPRTGEILAMVSLPSFDPNLFVNGISTTDYRALMDNPSRPLFNRNVVGGGPPGSTIKPFLALAGLDSGLRTPQDKVFSTGEFHIPGQRRGYRDAHGGEGWTDLRKSIAQSVNFYYYKLAYDMGIDRLDKWVHKYGFGETTGIDLMGESGGIVPSPEWKAKHSREPWYVGETVIAGIGQGFWAVTPLQLSHAIATFAGHGVPYAPRLVMATQGGVNAKPQPLANPPSGPSVIRNPADWDVVNQGMQQVIYGAKGTGRQLGIGFPYLMAGKSGTAERFSRRSEAYDTNRSTEYLATRHRAWFVAYAPADNPQIAVAAILESGAWGASAAGPIVRKILDTWLAGHDGVIADAKRLPVSAAPLPPAASLPPDAGVEDVEPVEDLPAQATTTGGTP